MDIPKHHELEGEDGPEGKEIVLKYYKIESMNILIENSSFFITNHRLLHETSKGKILSVPHYQVDKAEGTDKTIWQYGTLRILHTNGGVSFFYNPDGKKAAEYLNTTIYTDEAKKNRKIAAAKFQEQQLNYQRAIELYTEIGEPKETARVRKLKAELGAVKVTQKVVHGDEVTKTEIKDSVLNRSNVGGGSSKMQELRELKEMLAEGLIDDDEFKQMKKEILGK